MTTTTSSLHTPAHDLYFERAGYGPDILFLHGWASSGRMWTHLIEALDSHARCWSVDLAGFGLSPLPAHIRPDLDAHAAWLLDFMRLHHIRPRVIVGHSMGGMLALKLALAQPDVAERLVLMCPVVTGKFAFNAHQVFASNTWMRIAAKTQQVWRLMQSRSVAPVFSVPFYVPKEHHVRYIRDFQRTRWDAGMAALESMSHTSLEAELSTIHQPALIIVGQNDFTVSPDEGRTAARLMPNTRLIEMPNVYHQPLDESPIQVLQWVEDFISAP